MGIHVPNFWAFWFIYFHVITLLLLMNLFHPNILVKGLGNETDRFALLKFKEAIATDPHGFLNSWNNSFHFCNWHGITCGTRHQRVVALNLKGYNFHGTISPYIGNLSFLRFINLINNSFSGKIPQQVDHLFRLRHLNLSNNMLVGGIPLNLTFCRELRIITIGSNRLTGNIPSELGSLMKLVVLNLQKNNLTGGISPSLGNLSSIKALSLELNNLAGNVPEEIGRLRSLSLFSIGPNQLSGMIPLSIFNISSMNTFSITGNAFWGNIPPGIGLNMPNLQRIHIGANEFSGPIPTSLSNASQLQYFDIGENHFVGQVPKHFGNLPNLRFLGLHQNNLGSYSAIDLGFITSLINCSKLEVLDLFNNKFGGVLPNSLANLSTHLTYLYLGRNQISGIIPETLGNLNNLIALGLNYNLFTSVIPTSVGKFQKLQALFLENNRLSGRIPFSIGNLNHLSQLYLSANELEGSIPPSFENCQSLQVMDISHNRLSGDIPPQLIGLSSLLYLNLSQNSFTGSLPVEVSKLRNIYNLDVSENNLTKEIPEIIGECLSLEFLYLQGNLFQGIIPSSLASLKGLQYLDLSRNNLSGKIPKDVQRLKFLLYFNLSFNNLEGEVPKEGVFRNTSAISLVGNNTKLCGGVSELHLPTCPIKVSKQRKMHGFKLKLTISLVLGCSLLFAFLFALYWRRNMQKEPLSAVSSINFLSKISYQTLYHATGGFSPRNLIGSGGFGSVYKGILDQEEDNIVAIKVLNLQQKGASKSFTAECNALRNIRHKNLVKILTCCSSTDYSGNEFKALVFEYMSNGSLEEWLHTHNQSRSLNLHQRLNIVVDVAAALCYLHHQCEQPIIHCDLKPSNILLDNDMIAHVGDFGLARLISTTRNSSQSSTVGIKGTIGYTAPEYALGAKPSRQGDVYSYGILVLQMFTGRRPIDEMFKEGFNLHNFVKMAIPGRLAQIVDHALLTTLEETTPAATGNEVNYLNSGYDNEIEVEEENIEYKNLSKMNTYVWKFILPILKIGLACSEESPKNRMSMEDVTRDLHQIQDAYIGVQIHRERSRRS